MKSTTTVKENYEFRRMYAKGKSGVSSCLVVYYRKNRLGHNRLGVTVSTKLGHAVVRNRIRRRIRDKNGQMRGMEYTVLEQPQPPEQGPAEAAPKCAQPKQAKPKREKPVQENPAQLNTKEINKEETNNVSNPIRAAGQRTEYRALLLKNIEYPILAQNNPMDTMRLDELVELMLDVVCSKRAAIRIAGENMPAEVVKSRFLKLNAEHIQYVLDCLKDNPPRIRNIKQYLLAALYNAPLTIENYYAAQIDYDLCGGKR